MAAEDSRLSLSRTDSETVRVGLRGDWKLEGGLPSSNEIGRYLEAAGPVRRLAVDGAQIGAWDSSLLAFLVGLQNLCRGRSIRFESESMPEGVRRLLNLAFAVPERKGARRTEKRLDFLTMIGTESLGIWKQFGQMLEFLGESIRVFGRLMLGRARFRGSDLVEIIFDCGAAALPICTLISFLVGLILAFVGAIQLQQFGAEIYVANLVGIAMAREMGALMTAIIMAGRTGAAFAAQLGTMQVNEEIDALTTFGLSSMDFLVLPRMIALIIMMPLLRIYADLMGILGGALVGVGMLDLSVTEYVNQTLGGITLTDFAVGLAATSAVVTGIVFIIVTDGVFAVLTNVLGI